MPCQSPRPRKSPRQKRSTPPKAVRPVEQSGMRADSAPSADDETRETGPERTCAVTRRKGAPETMIRFVIGPDDSVVPDIRCKLPGRGVWIDAQGASVAAAVRKNAFARGFKAKVAVATTLDADVEELLARDALQSLAMANKAGAVTTGFAKVEASLDASRATAVLHAADAGADGIRKLEAAARRASETKGRPLSVKLFTSQQLDLALGRTNVIHAALAAGPASDAFLTRCHKLINYRSAAPVDDGADAKAAPA